MGSLINRLSYGALLASVGVGTFFIADHYRTFAHSGLSKLDTQVIIGREGKDLLVVDKNEPFIINYAGKDKDGLKKLEIVLDNYVVVHEQDANQKHQYSTLFGTKTHDLFGTD